MAFGKGALPIAAQQCGEMVDVALSDNGGSCTAHHRCRRPSKGMRFGDLSGDAANLSQETLAMHYERGR